MFSKRHYVAIAKVLRESNGNNKYQIALELAELFREDNERFSFKKFSKACGITA